jgi:hypothetical protein
MKRLSIAIAAIVLATLSACNNKTGRTGGYAGKVESDSGRGLKTEPAMIAVCRYNAQFKCSELVPIFADKEFTIPLTNPFSTDARGDYSFYAVPEAKPFLVEIRVDGKPKQTLIYRNGIQSVNSAPSQ